MAEDEISVHSDDVLFTSFQLMVNTLGPCGSKEEENLPDTYRVLHNKLIK